LTAALDGGELQLKLTVLRCYLETAIFRNGRTGSATIFPNDGVNPHDLTYTDEEGKNTVLPLILVSTNRILKYTYCVLYESFTLKVTQCVHLHGIVFRYR
jgi:hypothetical protein